MTSDSEIEKILIHVMEEFSNHPTVEQLTIENTISEVQFNSGQIIEYFKTLVRNAESKISKKSKTKGINGTWFRAYQEEYYKTPLSFTGSLKSAGRFHFQGEETLYLAENYDTCFHEIRFPQYLCPTTIVGVEVNLQSILDLSSESKCKKYDIDYSLLLGSWKKFNNIQIQYYTQLLAHMIRSYPFEGILYNSTVNKGKKCLLIFPMKLIKGSFLNVINPNNKMDSQFINISVF